MRYRGGGRIAGFDERIPDNYSYPGRSPGSWHLGEACQWLGVDRWPSRKISIALGLGAKELTADLWRVDTTVGGVALDSTTNPPTIRGDVNSEYPEASTVFWQKSTNGGASWSTIANNANHSVQASGYLALFNQRRADDGTLYRMVATNGLRYGLSDNVVVWNDVVGITWQVHPSDGFIGGTANISVADEIELEAQATATGQYHGLTYRVEYAWEVSSSQSGPWTTLPPNQVGDREGTQKFIPLTSGTAYVRARATFTYSALNYPVSDRPDVVSHSNIIQINVS